MGFGIKSAFKKIKKTVKKITSPIHDAVDSVKKAVGLDKFEDKVLQKDSIDKGLKQLRRGNVFNAVKSAGRLVTNPVDEIFIKPSQSLGEEGVGLFERAVGKPLEKVGQKTRDSIIKPPPKPPRIDATPVMPDIDEEAVNRARRRMIARSQGGGRTGTILGGTGSGIG